ncbi:hypothetical protein [Spiroplasma endosymbiont of Zeiraphera isertana]|uniref:hypothetical protein n=1 Tax=Spiroplasma endosymbiont of Zeiraphera isertana TaxID=3066313 RepID=UPI00313C229C
MKRLITTITLSALVGTSTNNLKPVFTSNVVNHGFKSNQVNNKEINIKNENDINPFVPRQINKFDGIIIKCNTFSKTGVIYLGTDKGLYKSTDGFNFKSIGNLTDKTITSIVITDDGIVLVGTDKGLYKSTDDEKLLNIISWTSNKKVNSIKWSH